MQLTFKLLNANPTKWSNTLKQFVGNLPTNCLSVFDQFVKLAPKGLTHKHAHWICDTISKFFFHLDDLNSIWPSVVWCNVTWNLQFVSQQIFVIRYFIFSVFVTNLRELITVNCICDVSS